MVSSGECAVMDFVDSCGIMPSSKDSILRLVPPSSRLVRTHHLAKAGVL